MKMFLNSSVKSLAILMVLSLSISAFSDVKTEFAILVPTQKLPKKIQHSVQFDSMSIPVSGFDLQPVVSAPKLDLSLDEISYNTQDNLLYINVQKLAARFSTPSLSAQGVIHYNTDDYNLAVRVDATCENLIIQQANASLQLAFNQNLEIVGSNVAWSNQDWNVNFGNCVAPAGTQDLIKKHLMEFFSNTSYVKNLFQVEFNKRFTAMLTSQLVNYKNMSFNFSNRFLVMPSHEISLVFLNDKIALKSSFIQTSEQEATYNLDLEKITQAPVNHIQVYVPQQYIKSTVENELIHQVQNFSYKLNENSSFKQLLRSRFMQFFLWPALMKVEKHSELVLKSQVIPKVNFLNSENSVRVEVQANFTSSIFKVLPESTTRFVDFQSRVGLKTEISQSSSNVQAKTDITQFDILSDKIPSLVKGLVKGFLVSKIEKSVINMNLSNEFLDSMKLKLDTMKVQDDSFVFVLSNSI